MQVARVVIERTTHAHFLWLGGLAALLVIAALYVTYVPLGWIPPDDGLMGQMAERAAQGERAHVDFEDPYSGWLNHWHATGFKALGVSMLSLRVQLAACFLFALATLAWQLRGILPTPLIMGFVLAGAVVGPMQYPAPMPSWYNLVLAMLALAAILAWIRRPRRRYLLLAGLFCGLSVTVKVIGVYAVAAGALAIVFLEPHGAPRPRWFVRLRLLLAAACTAGAAWVLGRHPSAGFYALLGMPVVLAAGALVMSQWGPGQGEMRRGLASLRSIAIYAAGVALPLTAFIMPYVADGQVGTLIDGLWTRPQQRFDSTVTAGVIPPSTRYELAVVVAMMCFAAWRGYLAVWAATIALGILLAAALVTADAWSWVHMQWWGLIRTLALGAGVLAIALARGPESGDVARAAIATAIFGAYVQLVQFPYAHGIYTLYGLPLALLACVAGLSARRLAAPAGVLCLALTLFGSYGVVRSDLRYLGVFHHPRAPHAVLDVPRIGIAARDSLLPVYRDLVRLLAPLRGQCIYAGPDAPEVAFLIAADYCHPTFYDMIAPGYADAMAFERDRLDWLDRHRPAAVVLNLNAGYSRRYSRAFMEELRSHYGRWFVIGKSFLVGLEPVGATPPD